MKIVWDRDAVTVRDVYEALLERRKVAYTTVMTMMNDPGAEEVSAAESSPTGPMCTPAQPARTGDRAAWSASSSNRVFNGSAEPLLRAPGRRSKALGERPRGNPRADPKGALQMTDLILGNLIAYSVQIAILIGIAALLNAILRLTPAARLYSFQALLACCLAIPFLQPWQFPAANSLVTTSTILLSTASPASDPTKGWRPSPPEIALAIIASGVLVRIGFILLGFWRLRRYLDRAVSCPRRFRSRRSALARGPTCSSRRN